ncbi:MAG: hypothetical protein AB7T32_13115 [Dehalococcoidia bacterium]
MTTLADLRDRLRIELHDVDETRWDDDALDRHLHRAVRELSSRAPRERVTTLATTAGSRELSLEALADLVEVAAVEYPVNEYPARLVRFSVYAGTLTLLVDTAPGDGEDVNVYWGSVHEVDDDSCTLPAVQEDIVVGGAAGYAAVEWASFATNRANIGGVEAVEQYAAWGADALSRFKEQLGRLREVSRVRTGTLFSPAGASLSRSVVQFEA